MHCHIAGPKVNGARRMQPEQGRIGNHRFDRTAPLGSVPDIITTGFRYAGLGYTTCFDAAVAPLAARHVHHEFGQVPNIDTGCYILVGNNHYVLERIAAGDGAGLESFFGWLLQRTGGYALKLVNPGGVELWKQRAGGNARDLDQPLDGWEITPRQIVSEVARAANAVDLPHPIHLHCHNLGIPGNWRTTLETMRTLDGLKSHLTHIQFHSYGGQGDQDAAMTSRVGPLVEYINAHPEISVDVGQVMFGETTSLTGDSPLAERLQQISGRKWMSCDVELESGCGISPIRYRNRNFVNALQWAIGLEWFLRVDNPWQVALSSDHPNGASFLAYPRIIRLLMDRDFRSEQLQEVPPRVLRHTCLPDLDRQYTLTEVAIVTRAAPARMLGLKDKGHLGPGADADITIYTPDRNRETMFAWPWGVVQRGVVLIEDGEFVGQSAGRTLTVQPAWDRDRESQIEDWIDRHYSLTHRHFGLGAGLGPTH